jgi:hypothetical protein
MAKPDSHVLALSRLAAKRLDGSHCLFKDRSYIGPVHVDSAVCDSEWITVSMTTRPWLSSSKSRTIHLQMPVSGTSASAFSVLLDAGYGVNGTFVHQPDAIQAIEDLRSSGADTQALLWAVSRSQGLPVEVRALRGKPLI